MVILLEWFEGSATGRAGAQRRRSGAAEEKTRRAVKSVSIGEASL
jgi:hypothetical protein